jgi:hypothetical protein
MTHYTSEFCNKCGTALRGHYLAPTKSRHILLKTVIIGFAVLVILAMIGGLSNTPPPPPQPTDSIGRPVSASVTNDAELLLQRCGKPDIDDSTEHDNPRPPIPTRFIVYRKARLKFAYVPGGDTKVGDPPPYRWTFIGVMDTRTNKVVPASELKHTISSRLPCFVGQ